MQRYFLKEKKDNQLMLYEQDEHHIKKVMRNKENDHIEAVWQDTIYLCNIDSINPLTLSIIDERKEDCDLNIELTIAVSLVYEQKFDLILQKLTELGVSRIIPVKTERSIVKVDDSKITKKYQRWQTICKEASEQSHRTNIPKVERIMTLQELTKEVADTKLICSLGESTKPLHTYLNENIKSLLFVIGPEGGFSEKEEKLLVENSFERTTLGKRVLRVETAAMYVASIINYVYGG